MKTSRIAVLLLLTASLVPTAARAADAAAPAPGAAGGPPEGAAPAAQEGPPQAPPEPGLISGFLSNEFTTSYFWRGFLQEDEGLIAQPILNLSLNAYRSDGPLTALSFNVGSRESVHSKETGAIGEPRAWYESDMFAGASVTLAKRFKFDAMYVAINSPNGAFDLVQELDGQFTFLDDGIFGEATLHPYALLVREVSGSAAMGPQGTYLELGIEPAFPLIKSRAFPVRLSFPIRVGLSLDNYYRLQTPFGLTSDENYGYTRAGVSAMMPLTFLPREMGPVFLAGVDVILLDNNLKLVNHDNDSAIIGKIGFIWAF